MITVCGSINVDLVFPMTTLPRVGETVLGASYAAVAGGKGANQAVAAARDGAVVAFYGCVGADGFGALARDSLAASGVDTSGIRRVETPTGCAAVCVDAAGRNQIVVASGANRDVRAAQVPDAALALGGTLVLQMEIPAAETLRLIARAKAKGCRTVFNLAPALPIAPEAPRAADIVVVNDGEAAALAPALQVAASESEVLVRRLAGALGNTVVITLGERGAVAAQGGEAWRIGALRIDAVDTTGAGDAFVGVLATALDAGRDFPTALRRASVAGGLCCLTAGAVPSFPTKQAIDTRLGDLAPARRF